MQTRTFVYVADWWRHLVAESKHASLSVSAAALNLIFGTLSAQFKFNNNVQRWNWQSWFIYGSITAAAGFCSVNTAGAAGNSHFYVLCTVQRPLMFMRLMNWTSHPK